MATTKKPKLTVGLKKAEAEQVLGFKDTSSYNVSLETETQKIIHSELHPFLDSIVQSKAGKAQIASPLNLIQSSETFFHEIVTAELFNNVLASAPWLKQDRASKSYTSIFNRDGVSQQGMSVFPPGAVRSSGYCSVKLSGQKELLQKVPVLERYVQNIQTFLWQNLLPVRVKMTVMSETEPSPVKNRGTSKARVSRWVRQGGPEVAVVIDFMVAFPYLVLNTDFSTGFYPKNRLKWSQNFAPFQDLGMGCLTTGATTFDRLTFPVNWLTRDEMGAFVGEKETSQNVVIDGKAWPMGVILRDASVTRSTSWSDNPSTISGRLRGSIDLNLAYLTSRTKDALTPFGKQVFELKHSDYFVSPRGALLLTKEFLKMLVSLGRLCESSSLDKYLPEAL